MVVVGIVSIVSFYQVLLWDKCTTQGLIGGKVGHNRTITQTVAVWLDLGVEKHDVLREKGQKLKSVRRKVTNGTVFLPLVFTF